jgi:hypothetical protein
MLINIDNMVMNYIEYDDDYSDDLSRVSFCYHDEEIRICIVCEKKNAIHQGKYCGGYCEYLQYKKQQKKKKSYYK